MFIQVGSSKLSNKLKYIAYLVFFFSLFWNLYSESRWVQVKSPAAEFEGIRGLYCFENNCIAFGDLTLKVAIYKSSDYGKTWSNFIEKELLSPSNATNILNCLAYNENQFYLNFSDGVALEKSIDSGKTFHRHHFGEISTLDYENFYDIVMFNESIGSATTRSTLVLTDDNWRTHKQIEIPDTIKVTDPFFYIDSNNIAICNYAYKHIDLVKYDIKAGEWSFYSRIESKIRFEMSKLLTDIFFVNDTVGYGCGFQRTDNDDLLLDMMWKTTDRGKSWKRIMFQPNNPGFGLSDISFKNELHGLAVGSWGKILETTDGGDSWFQHPVLKEMASVGSSITWAEDYPLYSAQSRGIFRLETLSEVEELSSDHKFRVYQSGSNLEIAINDESHSTYSFQLFNSSGQQLLTTSVKSSFGFVFEPVPLVALTNGVYYYTISHNNSIEFNGKLVVVE